MKRDFCSDFENNKLSELENEPETLSESTKKGAVTLVGAGCGKGLITAAGIEALKKAECVIYDDLIDDELLELPESKECRYIYVGKRSGRHSFSQDSINELIINAAKEGYETVRLKGGDSFVFGRGGEELLALKKAGIECSIIPGVSSCIAVPESVGIPVTHRKLAQSFTVVTGHTADGESENYEALAALKGTLVFLMGIKSISGICDRLIECGKAPETPAAVISRGFTEHARRVDGSLGDITGKARYAETPGILVVGETAGFKLLGDNDTENRTDEIKATKAHEAAEIHIYNAAENHVNRSGKKNLQGIRILVTGTESFTSKLKSMLSESGAVCEKHPTVKIVPQNDNVPSDFSDYDWIVFTSANGVKVFFDRLYIGDSDIRAVSNLHFACIGNGTKAELRKHGIKADFVPSEFTAQCLGRELGRLMNKGQKALILRAENGSKFLTKELEKAGVSFEDVHIYKTEPVCNDVYGGSYDYIVFGSAGGVKAWNECRNKNDIYEEKGIYLDISKKPEYNIYDIKTEKSAIGGKCFSKAVCIGEYTAAAYRELIGDEPIIAKEASADGIIKAIVEDIKTSGSSMKINMIR